MNTVTTAPAAPQRLRWRPSAALQVAHRPAQNRRLAATLLAAICALTLLLGPAGPASAATAPNSETAVAAQTLVAPTAIGSEEPGTPMFVGLQGAVGYDGVLGCCVAPTSAADDFVVLGKSDGLPGIADKLGGRHLMGSADWQADVLTTIANPNSRIAVALDGLEGAGSVSSRISAGVQRGASGAGSPFDWELAQLYQSGRLSTTELFENGVAISNPFG